MSRSARLAAALLAAAAGTAAVAAPAGAAPRARTVAAVGDEPVRLAPSGRAPALRYDLPANAHQGPGTWYVLRLAARVDVAPASGPGTSVLTALTNGFAVARITIRVDRSGAPRWSATGIATGDVSGRGRGAALRIRFRNYLQLRGVRPGRNALRFRLESNPGVRLAGVSIAPATRIVATPAAPPHLVLSIGDPPRAVTTGERFTIPYTVANTGDVTGAGVVLDVVSLSPGLRVLGVEPGPANQRVPGIAPGRIELLALRPGRHRVAVRVDGGPGRPGALVTVPVSDPAGMDGPSRTLGWLAVAAALAAAVALRLRARRTDGRVG